MWLKKKASRVSVPEGKEISAATYVDLLPNENADVDGIYAQALGYALNHHRIRNIAVTGPYGSGKSSVIASFAKRNQRKYTFLNLSLASFKETDPAANDPDADRQIERSILQQMLYGVEASRLPFSRFKRIVAPRYALPKSALILAWLITAPLLFFNSSLLLSPQILTGSISLLTVATILIISFALAVPTLFLADIYRASVGFSLKKISLKNAEIEGGEHSEISILNRHIDEIIYFFDVIRCDVVVIEDLDRFGSPEIFVKLREINKLINDGRHGRPPVKFLYALKDDMFVHRSRAKFFDFIIPIIPVISSANSLDKIRERIRGTAFEQRINDLFLFEVSVYLDDLRCIHNIFNEYVVYYAQLPSDTLDATKLLAMVIYKNVYPDDFEALHYGKGILFGACALRTKITEIKKARYVERATELKTLLKAAENEHLQNVDELIQVYCARIVRRSGQRVREILIGAATFQLSHPIPFESFEPIFSESNIRLMLEPSSYSHSRTINLGASFADIEEEINPGMKFLDRKQQIDAKDKTNQTKLRGELKELEQKIVGLPYVKMCDLLREEDAKEHWGSSDGVKADIRLLRYLVNNGYIDDTYHLYTANFYEGTLTSNDHMFIVSIRDFRVPPPEQKIDTPKEVCRRMRSTDFHQPYVLNIYLFDYLVAPATNMPQRIDAAVSVIRNDFSAAEAFLSAYYIAGEHLEHFIAAVAARWPEFGAVALGSNLGAESLSNILKFVDHTVITTRMNDGGVLTDYLSNHGDSVFASNLVPPKTYDALIGLQVRFSNVESLDENRECVEYVQRHNLYKINTKNVLYLMRRGIGQRGANIELHEEQNLTCILSAEDSSMADYVRENIGEYVTNVLLALPNNTKENEAAIVYLLGSDVLNDEQKKEILRKEINVFDELDNVPVSAWRLLFEEGKIVPNWKNIGMYFSSDEHSDKILLAFLERKGVADALATESIKSSALPDERVKEIARFILSSESLEEHVYAQLISSIPYWYRDFSGIPRSRFSVLTTRKTVRLTEASFAQAAEDAAVQAQLIAKSFTSYVTEAEKYAVSDEVRILLLSYNLSPQEKIDICAGLSSNALIEDQGVATKVGAALTSLSCDISKVSDDIATAAICHTSNTIDALRLLILLIPRWEEAVILETLGRMPEPLCEIASYGKRPKLERSEVHVEFAKALEKRGAISSFKDEDDHVRIITWKSADHAGATDS